ncbi:unnamed protein product [Pleuronectes platessa]|uniref:Uncharacterized protein n=1 Tax=Pleuronectes platessa TaxID=8262 RepID=A0A9N7UKB6_PLEPL|nr:unnamed protein product [Pleuronectes platessa]
MRANGRIPGKQNQCPGLLSGAPVGLVVATEISAGPNRANFSCSWNGIQLRLFFRDVELVLLSGMNLALLQGVCWHPAGLWPNNYYLISVDMGGSRWVSGAFCECWAVKQLSETMTLTKMDEKAAQDAVHYILERVLKWW